MQRTTVKRSQGKPRVKLLRAEQTMEAWLVTVRGNLKTLLGPFSILNSKGSGFLVSTD